MRNQLTSLLEYIHKHITNIHQFEDILRERVNHPDFRVRLALLRHPFCQQKHLHYFIEDQSWQVLTALVDRGDLPEEHYRYLYKYKKGIHSFLDFALDQHELKKKIDINND